MDTETKPELEVNDCQYVYPDGPYGGKSCKDLNKAKAAADAVHDVTLHDECTLHDLSGCLYHAYVPVAPAPLCPVCCEKRPQSDYPTCPVCMPTYTSRDTGTWEFFNLTEHLRDFVDFLMDVELPMAARMELSAFLRKFHLYAKSEKAAYINYEVAKRTLSELNSQVRELTHLLEITEEARKYHKLTSDRRHSD